MAHENRRKPRVVSRRAKRLNRIGISCLPRKTSKVIVLRAKARMPCADPKSLRARHSLGVTSAERAMTTLHDDNEWTRLRVLVAVQREAEAEQLWHRGLMTVREWQLAKNELRRATLELRHQQTLTALALVPVFRHDRFGRPRRVAQPALAHVA
jgi:hypothetical protein